MRKPLAMLVVVALIATVLVLVLRNQFTIEHAEHSDEWACLGPEKAFSKSLEWREATVQLLSATQQEPVSVRKRICDYEFCYQNKPSLIMRDQLAAFVSKNGQTWAGMKHEFYIETKSGVLGISVPGMVLWSESGIVTQPPDKTDVDSLTTRFEKDNHLIACANTRPQFDREIGKTNVKCLEHPDPYRTMEESIGLATPTKPINHFR
jgi:hypothetical protein